VAAVQELEEAGKSLSNLSAGRWGKRRAGMSAVHIMTSHYAVPSSNLLLCPHTGQRNILRAMALIVAWGRMTASRDAPMAKALQQRNFRIAAAAASVMAPPLPMLNRPAA
jgi:hypothetical protein